jgi:hypothetical protein
MDFFLQQHSSVVSQSCVPASAAVVSLQGPAQSAGGGCQETLQRLAEHDGAEASGAVALGQLGAGKPPQAGACY